MLVAIAVSTDLKPQLEQGEALAYVFCRRDEEKTQDHNEILGALAKQIIDKRLSIDPKIQSAFVESQRGERPDHGTILDVLKSVLSQQTLTYLVVDALDECKARIELVKDLLGLLQNTSLPPVKILLSSRNDLAGEVREHLEPYRQLKPDLGANMEDLIAYISYRFPSQSDTDVNHKIQQECIAKADGMFLWVELLYKSLPKDLPPGQKLQRIKDLLPGLGEMYERMLQDIWDQGEDVRKTAFMVLLWCMHAARPLDQWEMLEAVVDNSDSQTLSDLEEFKYAQPEHLVSICANLVFIDKDGYFRLCHESAKDYLQKRVSSSSRPVVEYQMLEANADEYLAQICLRYLLLQDFDRNSTSPDKRLTLSVSAKKGRFLVYAAKYWGRHVPQECAPSIQELVLRVVRSESRRALSMAIVLYDPNAEDPWQHPSSPTLLQVLSIFGLARIAQVMTDNIVLDSGTEGPSPLIFALSEQHHEMALWLLDHHHDTRTGSDILKTVVNFGARLGWTDVLVRLLSQDERLANATINNEIPPLSRACAAGKLEAASALIDFKAEVNAMDSDGNSPLAFATDGGFENIVKLLLSRGADPNVSTSIGETPLHIAAQGKHFNIFKELLAADASLQVTTSVDHYSPLHYAAESEATEIIGEILLRGFDVNAEAADGRTALHFAALTNSWHAAQRLLQQDGIAKDAVTKDGETALLIAAGAEALETVSVLVQAGCDILKPDLKDNIAFHAAALAGNFAVFSLLLRSQPVASVPTVLNLQNKGGETSLHRAVQSGNVDIVKHLLNTGAKPTIDGLLQSSPLHYAAHFGHAVMIRPILEHTKNACPLNSDNDTPLHFAARARNTDFVRQFLKICDEMRLAVQVDARNKFKDTALMVALNKSCTDCAQLLAYRCSVSKPDSSKNHAIHLAAWHGLASVVETLLKLDGTTSKGFFGRTPYCCAATRGHLHVLHLLAVTEGAVLDEPENSSATPLLSALREGHLDVANYLLDLGASHDVRDENGTTPLHLAAARGDVLLLRRLHNLGHPVDVVDEVGRTAFHAAAEAGNAENLNALIEISPVTAHAKDRSHSTCALTAAGAGNLEVFQRLHELGVEYRVPDHFQRSATYHAADAGHCDILQFLSQRGALQDLEDLDGNTPLLEAADGGYLDSVRFLLNAQPHTINSYNKTHGTSPLIAAAEKCHPLTIRALLGAGADPYHRDKMGMSALDYAAHYKPSLQEMHKFGHFREPGSLNGQQQVLQNTIKQSCDVLINLPRDATTAALFPWLTQARTLLYALQHGEDFENAKVVSMDLYWPERTAVAQLTFRCDICQTKMFTENKYHCRDCPIGADICSKCFKEYEEAGNELPDAVALALTLEARLQPLRNCIPDELSFNYVYQALVYHDSGCVWLSGMLDAYDTWEQKYNSDNRYRNLPRPGQTLLKTVRAWQSTFRRIARLGDIGEDERLELRKEIDDLEKKYDESRREHRSDKEPNVFACSGHSLLLISEEERDGEISKQQNLDSRGKLTEVFLRELRTKYSDEASQPQGMAQSPPLRRSFTAVDRSVDTERQRLVRRAYTSQWRADAAPPKKTWPHAPLTIRNALEVVGRKKNDNPGTSRSASVVASTKARPGVLRTATLNVEMKSVSAKTDVQEAIDGDFDPTDTNTVRASESRQTHETVSIAVVAGPAVGEDKGAVVLGEPSSFENLQPVVLGEALVSDPETINEEVPNTEQQEDTAAAVETEVNENYLTDLELIRIAYVVHTGDNADVEKALVWAMAMNAIEAMMPGSMEKLLAEAQENAAGEAETHAASPAAGRDNGSDDEGQIDDSDDSD